MKWFFLSLLLCSFSAMAGIYIEPYAGYGIVKTDMQLTGTLDGTPFEDIDESDSDGGAVYGGKLGYSIPFLTLGGDYMATSSSTDLGPFIEFRLPVFLKFRASYFVSSEAEEDDYGFKFEGSGFKVGLGFSLFANLTLNLDYYSVKYDEETGDVDGFELDTVDIKRDGVLLTLGLPFEFF